MLNIDDFESTAPDWDPETDVESISQDEEAREHYVAVGKSKLRKNLDLPVDPKYNGNKVTRKEIESDSDEELVFDGEMSSENEFPNDAIDDGLEFQALEESDIQTENEFRNESENESERDSDTAIEEDLISKLMKQENDEKAFVKNLSEAAKADVEKGKHVVEQLSLWDGLLDMRIRIQKAVDSANILPREETFQEFVKVNETPELLESINETSKEIRSLFDSLLDVRTALIKPDHITADLETIKRKRDALDMDEWISTSISEVLEPLETGYKQFRNETIDKWNNKVQAANGIPLQKKFKVINQSVVSQIEAAEGDQEKLIKRTQLNRSNYKVIGKISNTTNSEKQDSIDTHLNDYDDQIFDDGDYYQQLLKELIDGRMTDSNDPVVLAMRYAQLKQLQKKKSNKNVDTKASKGRKIRYEVQEKIQNFMAPEPRGTWHDDMTQELFASLFGKKDIEQPEMPVLDDGFKIL